MHLILSFFVLVLALQALPRPLVLAASVPAPGTQDPRLRWVVYNEREVIEVRGHYGYQTLVQFGASEEVTDVSLGDGLAWHVDIPARKNLLFLKPVAAYAATNLTVLTNRPSLDGSGPLVRVYVFSLVANIPREEGISAALHAAESAAAIPTSGSSATTPADFTWVIHFHYPEDQAERLALRVRRNQTRQLSRISTGRAGSETGIDPAAWNWQYTFAGASTQAPVNVFDDGRHTYFQFDPKTRVPAIFMVHPDETESLVNAVRRGRFLVVHDIGRQFTLRNGPVETCVFNEGFHPEPARTLNSPRHDPAYMERSGTEHRRTPPEYSQRDGRPRSAPPPFPLGGGRGQPSWEYNRPPGAEYRPPAAPTTRPPARSEYNRNRTPALGAARPKYEVHPEYNQRRRPEPRAFTQPEYTPPPRPEPRQHAAPEYNRPRPPHPPPRLLPPHQHTRPPLPSGTGLEYWGESPAAPREQRRPEYNAAPRAGYSAPRPPAPPAQPPRRYNDRPSGEYAEQRGRGYTDRPPIEYIDRRRRD